MPFEQVGARRYAHVECAKKKEAEKTEEERNKEKLEQYIKKLFRTDVISVKIKKQIKTFQTQYNYTYSGILKALIYFYEVKQNSTEKSNDGIGIVPYVYQEAYNYYYNLWLVQQANKDKNIDEYIPTVVEIKIPSPQRKIKKRKRFTFLDNDEVT